MNEEMHTIDKGISSTSKRQIGDWCQIDLQGEISCCWFHEKTSF